MDRGCYDYQRTNVKILDEIHHTLLSYLSVEESMEKIEQKRKLEGLIKYFLNQVPHLKKFTFIETAEVLRKSVIDRPELPFYKINAAWTALINYAQQLVTQPWRKEFREIKTYCGYYKHHIGESLFGGEIILQLMGYHKICEGTLVLDGPVDPDRVTSVTQDAFIALVECKIVRFIYEELIKIHIHPSRSDILQYRENHIGPPESAIHEMKLMSHRYEHFRSSELYPKRSEHYPYAYNQPRYHACQPHSPMYGVLSPHQTLPPSYSVYAPINGYNSRPLPHECQPVPSTYNCSVPIAQLIEFDASHQNTDSIYYSGGSHKRTSYDYSTERAGSRLHDDHCAKKFKVKDFVDGSHERKYGASRAHVNECDVASFSESMKSLRLDETGVDASADKRSPLRNAEVKNGVRLKNTPEGGPLSVRSLSRDNKPKKPPVDSSCAKKTESEVWACVYCTYYNDKSKKICAMCHKSRFLENELQPLEIGGRQCGNCTLVNLKGAVACAACGESLEDSSTYI